MSPCNDNEIVIDLVPNATIGDYTTAKGALMKAASEFVDWEGLHNGEADAIGAPGRILLDLAHRLPGD